MLDKTDALIYVVGVDQGTTPNTYYLASINAAGTLTNIGNAQPSVDFSTPSGSWWFVSAAGSSASSIRRDSDGAGNIFMAQFTTGGTGMEEMEIDITNGTITTDPTTINDNMASLMSAKTTSGLYIAATGASDSVVSTSVASSTVQYPILYLDRQSGWMQNVSTSRIIQWKGYYAVTGPSSTVFGPRNWSFSAMNALAVQIKNIS
jgi:hypothetical protein